MLIAAALLAFVAFLAAAPARSDVGVETVSRPAAAPGDEVDVTLGCGFCFPPCKRASGKQSGPCMPGAAQPPASFPVSLVPIERAPEPHRCGPNALCAPRASAPPAHSPFSLLGEATPPLDRGSAGNASRVPRYVLNFAVPDLSPGVYTYVIYCDACLAGKGGSLIADPRARPWRLRVRR